MKPEEFLQTESQMSCQEKLAQLVGVLRGPEGCAWDQKQSAHNIIDFVIDEAHELKSALAKGDSSDITSELGDLLFTIEFLTQTLPGGISKDAAAEGLVEKMIRRHPHVFAGRHFSTERELKKNWESEKRKESAERSRYDQDIPASLPPLQRAFKVLSRAMNAGFQYPTEEEAWDKVCEEFFELESALFSEDSKNFEEELGDLMLALLTLAKMRGAKPGEALRNSTSKLCDRLQSLEEKARTPIEAIPRQDLAGLYAQVKHESTSARAYFNYCGVSPWPRPVRQALRRASHLLARDGLAAALALRQEREELRSRIKNFCGAPTEASLVYVPNVSSAALGVAYCQNWRKGDAILLGQHEFPANTVPWRAAAATLELQVFWFDEDLFRREPERAWSELKQILEEKRPRLLALSAVSFWSGFRLPLEKIVELCAPYEVKLFIDGIQALGTVPLHMGGVDFLAGGSHKNLLAPEGAGFLLVSEKNARDWVPRLPSWLSLPDAVDFLTQGIQDSIPNLREPREADPTSLEGGSLNSLGYAGLGASIDCLSQIGIEQIFSRIQTLQDPLEESLIEGGWKSLRSPRPEGRSAILSFEAPSGIDVREVQEYLREHQVSVGLPNGRLRFGFHTFTQRWEVDRVIQLLRT